MYNRYIPQPDGSYRRNRVPDMSSEAPRPMPPREEPRRSPPPQEPCPPEQEAPPCRNGQPCGQPRSSCRPSPPPRSNPPQQTPPQNSQPHRDTGAGSFLRQLLPKDFSTEDLLVVLLLLLMAGDCQENQNSALLTLALYLFL